MVVRHPENIGQAPQIFQSYHVHTCPILRVVLGEKHLISGGCGIGRGGGHGSGCGIGHVVGVAGVAQKHAASNENL